MANGPGRAERGGDEQLGRRRADGGRESLVMAQLLQVEQGQAVNAQAVFEAGVPRCRIDQRDQAQLADSRQAAEIGGVNDLPHSRRQRHVHFRRNADHRPPGVESGNFKYL